MTSFRVRVIGDDILNNSVIGGNAERMFQSVFSVMNEGVVIRSGNAAIIAVNPAAERMLGLAAAKLIGRHSLALAGALIDQHGADLDDFPSASNTGIALCDTTLGIRRTDGTLIWLSVDSQPLLTDGASAPYPVATIFRQIARSESTKFAAGDAGMYRRLLEHQKLIQTSMDGFWVARTRDARILEANDVFCDMVGYSREELLSMCISDLEADESPAETAAHIRKVMSAGYDRFETRHRHKLGHLVELEVSVSCTENNGDMTFVFVRDVTERKRMERDIAAREQEFRTLAESSPDCVIRYDREGRMRYFNPGLLGYWGLDAADVMGKRPEEVWPDGRYAEIDKAIVRALETEEVSIAEFCEADSEGALRYSQIHVVPERGAAGQVVGAIAFGRDVTAIREAERQLNHFFENLPGMAYTFRLSPDGSASFPCVSPAIGELYGIAPEDVKGDMAPIHTLAHPDDRPRIEAALAESARTLSPLRIESRVCRPGLPVRWLDVRSVPEREADGSIVWYGIMLDITERKRTEDALYFIAQRGWLDGEDRFFDALVQYLGTTLGVDYVFIDRLGNAPDVAETVALYARGEIAPNMRYGLKGTPCENVIGREFCFYPQGVRQRFPEDAALVQMGAESYAGIPLWDSSGQPIGLIAVVDSKPLPCDGTIARLLQLVAIRAAAELERERSERDLRERERKFRSLAENLPDNIVRYDREGVTVYVNPVLERTLGDSASAMIGTTPRQYHPDGSFEDYAGLLDAVLASGEAGEIEKVFSDPAGGERVHQIQMVPERGESGELVGVLSIGRDITELKRAERQQRELAAHLQTVREEEKAHLARELHDDLGQILLLMKINVSAYSVRHEVGSGPLHEHLQEMLMLTAKAVAVVRNIISTLRPTALDYGISAALGWLAGKFCSSMDIQCEVQVEDEIRLDDGRAVALFRIVQESLSNVAKHANANKVEIILERNAADYVLKVRDNGIGFDAGAKKTGSFGLLGMKERTLMLGGALTIDSRPGAGTQIVVQMPV